MAKKRIRAHFMHERERDAARAKMSQVHETESYLLGEIEEKDVPVLKDQGLIIEPMDNLRVSEVSAGEAASSSLPRTRRMTTADSDSYESESSPAPPPVDFEPAGASAGYSELDREKTNFYLIDLRGPLLEDWRATLSDKGINLLEYLPGRGYTAKLSPEQAEAVLQLPFVQLIRVYSAKDTTPVEVRGAVIPRLPGVSPPPPALSPEKKMLTYDLRVHQEEDVPKVTQWLQQHGINIAGSKGRKIRLYLIEGTSLAESISAMPEVAEFEEHVPPTLHNDVARVLIGIDSSSHNPNPSSYISQKGQGQIIGVADTGIDKDHPDFNGAISGIVALGRPPGDASDFNGHGSHVAGSIVGNGASSQGLIRGMAPEAKIFFQSLMDAQGRLGGLPLSLEELFEQAYQEGARIHNNSWGSATNSFYTINSMEVDEFVAKRRDMLVIISAGNEGRSDNARNVDKGYVDWLSIGSPASCKNSLTVGASRSSRTSGGLSRTKYADAFLGFRNPPIGEELVSGNPECMAAFSSRGPCDDYRIKPDLIAPGTDIASVRSSIAPLRNYWGGYPGNSKYAFMGGTSMSAPIVAGCAALVRQYYLQERNHEPSAALLKATLINGTRWLTGCDAIAEYGTAPNYHQGFGCIHMPYTIPNTAEPNMRLEFVDTLKNQGMHFNRTGQRFRFTFKTNGGKWLRICLAWTDPPARALQNNLNLFVEHLPSAQKWLGNQDRPISLNIPDPTNNVEVVRLQNPAPGEYMVQVQATNLLKKDQDFALVVAGDLDPSTPLAPIPG